MGLELYQWVGLAAMAVCLAVWVIADVLRQRKRSEAIDRLALNFNIRRKPRESDEELRERCVRVFRFNVNRPVEPPAWWKGGDDGAA